MGMCRYPEKSDRLAMGSGIGQEAPEFIAESEIRFFRVSTVYPYLYGMGIGRYPKKSGGQDWVWVGTRKIR